MQLDTRPTSGAQQHRHQTQRQRDDDPMPDKRERVRVVADEQRSLRWGPILRPSSLGPDGTRGADTPPEDPPGGGPWEGVRDPPRTPPGTPPEGGPGGARGAPRGARAPPCTFLRVFNNSPIRDRCSNKTFLDGFFGGGNLPKIAPGGENPPPDRPPGCPRTRFRPPQDPPGDPPWGYFTEECPLHYGNKAPGGPPGPPK